jgi:hypothetical protein
MGTVTFIAFAAVGLASPWLYRKWRTAHLGPGQRSAEEVRARRQRALQSVSSKYRAVEVRPGLEACDVAWSQEGTRYLATEAPELPFKGCDIGECTCRYAKYADRRKGEDRRDKWGTYGGLNVRGLNNDDRREGEDRRQS